MHAAFIKRIPCLLIHSDIPACATDTTADRLAELILPTITVIERLLEGPPEEVTSDVWKAVLSMLRHILDHTKASETGVKLLVPFLRRGLSREPRPVRLEAG